MEDLYKILGVERDATQEDIKKAYKKLAIQYHPDKNPDNKESEDMMKNVNHAYDILGDEEKRRNYDNGGGQNFNIPGFDPRDFGFNFNPMGRQQRGRDFRVSLGLSFEEIYRGLEKEIKYSHTVKCNDCSGSGGKEESCNACGGQGIKVQIIDTGFGRMMNQQICSKCQGNGKFLVDPCKKCNGSGSIMKTDTLKIKIPEGVDDGHTFIVRGGGDYIRNGVSGDMHLIIQEIGDQMISRQGNDLLKKINLSYVDFLIGKDYILETFDGKIKITIPELSNVGDNLRIKGKGFKKNGIVGDMIIILQLVLPKQISNREKELLTEIKNLE